MRRSAALSIAYTGCLASILTMFAYSAGGVPNGNGVPHYKTVARLNLSSAFNTKTPWVASALQATGEDASEGGNPAKLCFRGGAPSRDNCTSITKRAENDPLSFAFQTPKELRVVAISKSEKAVLFDAQFWGGGSGTLEQVSLWTYDRFGDSFASDLTFEITGLGMYRVEATGPLEGSVITADCLWAEGETHFGAHRFTVSVYANLKTAGYVKVLEYLTDRKYPGEDSPNFSPSNADVIGHEYPKIQSLIRRLYPAGFASLR